MSNVGIAAILALSKLANETPDDVRKAAQIMIDAGGKNPLISGIIAARTAAEVAADAKADLPPVDGLAHATAVATLMLVKERLARIETEVAELTALITSVLDQAAAAKPAAGPVLATQDVAALDAIMAQSGLSVKDTTVFQKIKTQPGLSTRLGAARKPKGN